MAIRILVIGAGPGGYAAAVRAARLGAQVTVVEKENPGGTCLNQGCIPSKIMKTSADMLAGLAHAEQFGIRLQGAASLDIAGLMKRKDKVIQNQRNGILNLLKHHGIDYLNAVARISAHGEADVCAADGSRRRLPWDRLIIATGSSPLEVPALAFDHQGILSSNDILSLSELPASIVIVGGGVIGCEFASILSALGVQVTLVEALDRLLPLPSVDESCSATLQREMKKRKIQCYLNQTVQSVEPREGRLRLTISPSSPGPGSRTNEPTSTTVAADKVLVCVGRSPNHLSLGLHTVDVRLDPKGWIVADPQMRTSAPGVYAIGDALGPSRVMLAHVASREAMIAAENAMGGNASLDYATVPGAIFTSPEVANVGLTECQARERGIACRADEVLFRVLGKAQVMGELAGSAKIVSAAKDGRVLGVHLIGPHATDLIAEGTLAVQTGVTVHQLTETIHAHPTLAEIMLEVSLKAADMALHG